MENDQPGTVPAGGRDAQNALANSLARLRQGHPGPDGKPVSLKRMADDPGLPLSKTAASDYERGRRVLPDALVAAYATFFDTSAADLTRLVEAAQAEADGDDHDDADPEAGRRRTGRLVAAGIVLLVVVVIAVTLPFVLTRGGGGRHATGPTFPETTGGSARTWSDYGNAGGDPGRSLTPQQTVGVLCRTKGFIVEDGNPWWYRLAPAPWSGRFYATADAFYDDGATSGPLADGVIVDTKVPLC